MTRPDRDHEPAANDSTESPSGVSCDFCGEVVPSVRRIALDGDYERLRKPHQERYACPACSTKKENERLGLERG